MNRILQIFISTIMSALWVSGHTRAFAAEPETSGMITIEVVDNPSFFEQYSDWIYLGIIAVALGYFFWRRFQQGKVDQ